MTIQVVAIISPKPGKEERVKEGLSGLAQSVKDNEPGCLKYELFEQANGTGTKDFVVVEEYTDQAAFDSHKTTEWFATTAKLAQEEELLAKPFDIKVINKVAGFSGR